MFKVLIPLHFWLIQEDPHRVKVRGPFKAYVLFVAQITVKCDSYSKSVTKSDRSPEQTL